jgi:hypothetical protein
MSPPGIETGHHAGEYGTPPPSGDERFNECFLELVNSPLQFAPQERRSTIDMTR